MMFNTLILIFLLYMASFGVNRLMLSWLKFEVRHDYAFGKRAHLFCLVPVIPSLVFLFVLCVKWFEPILKYVYKFLIGEAD